MPSDFEQSFSDLAYAFLQQSGLDIAKYLIGFELADKNESESKGTGFFIIRIAGKFFYIPVFFINGAIKPLILMYDYDNDSFLPLDNDWIEYLEKMELPSLGKAVPNTMPSTSSVDVGSFMQPPFIGKMGSDLGYVLPAYLKNASGLTKNAFLQLMQDHHHFAKAIMKTYNMDIIKAACQYVLAKPKQPQCDVILIDDVKDADNLSPKDKIKFLKQGYILDDERSEEKQMEVRTGDFVGKACSPDETGIYDLLTNKGKRRCFIGLKPYDMYLGKHRPGAIVVDIDSGDYTKLPVDQLIVYKDENASPYEEAVNSKFKTVKKMKMGKNYLIFEPSSIKDKAGVVTLGFCVEQKNKGSDGETYFTVSQESFDTINILVKPGGKLSKLGIDVICPEDYLIVPLKEESLHVLGRPELIEDFYEYNDEIKVASFDLDKKAEITELNLYKNQNFHARFDCVKDAELYVASKFGTSVENAEKIVGTGKTYFVKKAFYPMGINAGAGQNFVYGNAPGGITETEYEVYDGDPKQMSNELKYDFDSISGEIDKAVSLSDAGMKDVFDKGVLGVMSKLRDVESELQSYIPDMLKCVDKLGRALYTFWIKGSKIKDRFSLNEFKETEDAIKENFKGLGSLVLEFKKKYMKN